MSIFAVILASYPAQCPGLIFGKVCRSHLVFKKFSFASIIILSNISSASPIRSSVSSLSFFLGPFYFIHPDFAAKKSLVADVSKTGRKGRNGVLSSYRNTRKRHPFLVAMLARDSPGKSGFCNNIIIQTLGSLSQHFSILSRF